MFNKKEKSLKNKEAFTLIELIVSMAIIAVLMGLSFYAVQAVQRNSRDTQRRAALSDINTEVVSWYTDTGSYPTLTLTNGGKTMMVGTRSVPLQAAAIGANAQISNSNVTGYCYSLDPSTNTYKLGVSLEGSGWGSPNTASQISNIAQSAGSICTTPMPIQ